MLFLIDSKVKNILNDLIKGYFLYFYNSDYVYFIASKHLNALIVNFLIR